MAVQTPETQFTRDILGNYVCNTLAEATNSGSFDAIVIGGGTFGLVLAQDLFFRAQRVGLGSVPQDMLKPPNGCAPTTAPVDFRLKYRLPT